MANKGTFKPGQSGNPNGRPPKNRALTAILETALNKTADTPDGRVKRKRIIAEHITLAATEGRVVLPDGETMELGPKEWIDLLKWIYSHIDGPPRAEIDVTSDGKPLASPIVYLPAVNEGDQ